MSNELTTNELPEYLKGEVAVQQDELLEYAVPNRMKIIQAMTSGELKKEFNPGDLVLTPSNSLVSPIGADKETGGDFVLTPLYYWKEYCLWNDYKLNSDENQDTVIARSTDPNGDLAAVLKDKDWTKRVIPHPDAEHAAEGMVATYVEHINILFCIKSGECAGELAINSFCKGNYMEGKAFLGKLSSKASKGFPMYACNFKANVFSKPNKKHADTFALAIKEVPLDGDVPRLVPAEEFGMLKEMAQEAKSRFEEGQLIVDHDSEKEDTVKDTLSGNEDY